jgi:manganese efflux pump family protein
MPVIEIVLLGLALSLDAFFVSFSYGLILKTHRHTNALRLGIATGLGQFVMPLLGYLSMTFAYRLDQFRSSIEACDHWIACIVFVLLGIKVYKESRDSSPSGDVPNQSTAKETLSFFQLVAIGLATSIDAFVAGISIYFMVNPAGSTATSSTLPLDAILATMTIGLITLTCAYVGFMIAKTLQHLPTRLLGAFAALVLIGLGIKIVIEHMSC